MIRKAVWALAWAAGLYVMFRALDWAVWSAVFRADASACGALAHAGACWGVVSAKAQPILLGFYPSESQWRPVLGLALVALSCGLTAAWGQGPGRLKALAVTWALTLSTALLLLRGGVLGLTSVPPDHWGGLPLTLALFAGAWLVSMPLGVLLAWGRRSPRAWISWPATTLIEVIRGVPLVTLLFAAAFMLPALLPAGWHIDLIWRGGLALTLFSAAYFAEVLRGGLQTIPQEQSEAAAILGLSWWQTQRLVVLPQALRAILPAWVGHTIGLLKDSSLVTVIGLHELTGGLSLSLGGDAQWRPFYLEAYLFVGAIYGLMCFALSRWGTKLEQRWPKAVA